MYTMSEVVMRMEMDVDNKISQLSSIGMALPGRTKKTMKKALDIVKTFDFYTEVYPKAIMEQLLKAVAEKKNI